jgi:hypothetical protein
VCAPAASHGVILSEAKNLSNAQLPETQRDSSGRSNGPQNDSEKRLAANDF